MLGKWAITAPIVGATKQHHVTPEEITFLEEAYIPHPVLGFK
jgi:hypothetical protein